VHVTPFSHVALADIPRFKDAAASIRRTTTQFNYQLVIQRAYEEGEEQFSESDDGDLEDGTSSQPTQTLSFLIFFVLNMRS